MSISEHLQKTANEMGIALTREQLAQFEAYFSALKEVGAHTNLTAVLDEKGVAEKHFAESLLPLALGLINGDETVVDIGSGAGFPGLPLKIACPTLTIALVEATGKKAAFIETAAKRAKTDVLVINGRAEEIAHNETARMWYDIGVSRAVARLNVLLELCAGFIKPGGRILAYKGDLAEEEVREARPAAKALGLTFIGLYGEELLGGKTRIAVYERTEKLKDIYPRKFSNIKNKAL